MSLLSAPLLSAPPLPASLLPASLLPASLLADLLSPAILIAEIAWQPIIAYVLVAFAAAWVLRRTWRTYQRATRGGTRPGEPAGGCGNCAQNTRGAERAKAKPLVQLSPKHRDDGSA